MRFSPSPPDLAAAVGFTPERDIFGRRGFAQGLTHLIRVAEQPLVIALDAGWGEGKTTFLSFWKQELESEGFPVVYFDAFEHDSSDDAFSVLAGEIVGLAQDKELENQGRAKRFIEKAGALGVVLARASLRIGVRAATMNLVSETDLANVAKEIGGEASGMIDGVVADLITRHRERKQTISDFRSALSHLPSLLSAKSAEIEGTQPLIIIVDELDRCRPPFALQILERMKHFFTVPNVHFVLGVHLGQLENSIRAAYGGQVDAQNYLMKFVTLSVNFPRLKQKHLGTVSEVYVQHLLREFTLPEDQRQVVQQIGDLLGATSASQRLTLREVERVLSYVVLALSFASQNVLRPPALIAGLCFLKVRRPDLFRKAKDGTLTYLEIAPLLIVSHGEQRREADLSAMRNWWGFILDPAFPPEQRERMNQSLWRYNTEGGSDLLRFVAEEVVDRIQPE